MTDLAPSRSGRSLPRSPEVTDRRAVAESQRAADGTASQYSGRRCEAVSLDGARCELDRGHRAKRGSDGTTRRLLHRTALHDWRE